MAAEEIPALAPEPPAPEPTFGKHDSFVFSVERILGFQEQDFGQSTTNNSIGFHPLYWSGIGVSRIWKGGLSVGLLFGFTYLHEPASGFGGKDQDSSLIWLRPRIGYAATARTVGVWLRFGPTLLMSFNHTQGDSHQAVAFGGELYGVARASKHVGILVGPHFEAKVAADKDANKYGSVGMTMGLMGEFW